MPPEDQDKNMPERDYGFGPVNTDELQGKGFPLAFERGGGSGGEGSVGEKERKERIEMEQWVNQVKKEIENGEASAFVHARVNFDLDPEGRLTHTDDGYQNVMLRGRGLEGKKADAMRDLCTTLSQEGQSDKIDDGFAGLPREYNRRNDTLYVSVADFDKMPPTVVVRYNDVLPENHGKSLIEFRYSQPKADESNRTAEKRVIFTVPTGTARKFEGMVQRGIDPNILKDSVADVFVGRQGRDLYDVNLVDRYSKPDSPVIKKEAERPTLVETYYQKITGEDEGWKLKADKKIITPIYIEPEAVVGEVQMPTSGPIKVKESAATDSGMTDEEIEESRKRITNGAPPAEPNKAFDRFKNTGELEILSKKEPLTPLQQISVMSLQTDLNNPEVYDDVSRLKGLSSVMANLPEGTRDYFQRMVDKRIDQLSPPQKPLKFRSESQKAPQVKTGAVDEAPASVKPDATSEELIRLDEPDESTVINLGPPAVEPNTDGGNKDKKVVGVLGAKDFYQKLAADPSMPQTRAYWESKREMLLREKIFTKEEIDQLIKNGREVDKGVVVGLRPEDMPEVNVLSARARKDAALGSKPSREWSQNLDEEIQNINGLSAQDLIGRLNNFRRGRLPKAYSSSPDGETRLDRALSDRLDVLKKEAEGLGLTGDLENKIDLMRKDLSDLETSFSLGQLQSNTPRVGQVFASINATRLEGSMNEPDKLRGLNQYLLDQAKRTIRLELENLQTRVREEEKKRGEIPDLRGYINEARYINTSTPEGLQEQRDKIRVLLGRIETADGSIRSEDEFKALVGFVELDPEKTDKGIFHPDVEREIRTSFHLCETVYAIRDSFNFDAKNFEGDMGRAVTKLEGDHFLLTMDDLEKLCIDGYEGLKIRDAFYLLQETALSGIGVQVNGEARVVKYAEKMDSKEGRAYRTRLIEVLQQRHGISKEVAERSLNLATKSARAKFEDLVWDRARKHPISQAIYFGDNLATKNRKFVSDGESVDVLNLGTSFDRHLAEVNPPYKSVFNTKLDELLRSDLSQPELASVWSVMARDSALSFDDASYVRGVDQDSYKKYLTDYLAAMVIARDEFTNASMGNIKSGDVVEWAGKILPKVDKIDPYGVQGLKVRIMRWAIRRGRRNIRVDWSAVDTEKALYSIMENGQINEDERQWIRKHADTLVGGMSTKFYQDLLKLVPVLK